MHVSRGNTGECPPPPPLSVPSLRVGAPKGGGAKGGTEEKGRKKGKRRKEKKKKRKKKGKRVQKRLNGAPTYKEGKQTRFSAPTCNDEKENFCTPTYKEGNKK